MKVTTTEGPITRNLKRLAMVTVAGIMMGGSASPLYANVPHVNVGLFRSQPVNISNRAPLQLVDADDSLKARGEVDADRIREHADRAEDRVSEDTHDAVRNARIHKERAEAGSASTRRGPKDGPTIASTMRADTMRWKSEMTIEVS
jgi:hypothetical protein